MSLEDAIRQLRLGYKIADDLLHDFETPSIAKHSIRMHEQRMEGFEKTATTLESLGFLSRVGIYYTARPYNLFNCCRNRTNK
jgi:exo-beta-1,3-glucanase (GH17 family)